jgi:hypothetical protein
VVERLSILDELRSGRFEASIATTYSIHFPFFETVVHRRLLGSGCLQQVVLADSGQCAAALASPDLRPEMAGNAYVLVPVSAPGAFHPKLHLLLGKRGGKLLIGSHNLTFSGFGGNAELTNLLAIDPKVRSSVAVARTALEAVRAWAHGQPALVEECLKAAEEVAPWLRGPTPTNASELLLWSAPGLKASLWDQLRPHLPARCSRVTVIGPFFDPELAFLRRLAEDLRPAELVVGVDPTYSELPVSKAKALKGVRFVDARGLLALLTTRRSGSDAVAVPPLHAKALWIEGDERELLVTGSANPSRAAWLDANRNAEAVLLRLDPTSDVLDDLALQRLHDAPEISEAEWELLRARTKPETTSSNASPRVAVAVADGDKLTIRGVPGTGPIESLVVRTRDGGVFTDLVVARNDDVVTITGPTEVIEAASLVELGAPATCVAVVHHAPRLRANGGSSGVQTELRTALGAMTADPSQLGSVMQIVEKAIFDEDGVRFRKGELQAATSRETEPATPLGSMSISLEKVKRRRGPRKSLAERNLAVVLDLLIHRLGQGLHEEPHTTSPPEVEEKDLEIVEPEVTPPNEPPADPVDAEALLRACHRKVKKLLTRMSQRLDKLDGSSEAAASAVAQLAAVLGVVRWLRRSEPTFAWLPPHESVIPDDARNQFLWDVAGHFAVPGESPIAVARVDLGDGGWQEASLALALLGWLGWECEIDRRTLKIHPDEEEQWDYGWVSRLTWVLREVILDEDASAMLQDTMGSVRRWRSDPSEWLREHGTWAEAVALAELAPKSAPTLRRGVQRGDLVRLDMPNGKCVIGYALNVDDRKVFVAAPDAEEGRPVLGRFVTVVDWALLAPKVVATAVS